MFEKIEKQLKDFYQEKLKTYNTKADTYNALGMGYKNLEAQLIRFEQLAKVIEEKENFSVNDLGMGSGDFFKFLLDKELKNFAFQGYDMFEEMVEIAQFIYKENNQASFHHIQSSADMKVADYSIACGILNLRYTISDEEWQKYILKTIHDLNDKSSKGFAFNALTTYSDKDKMREDLFYSDPCFLFDYCKRHFSRNVALLHDYTEYDFTIIVRKLS